MTAITINLPDPLARYAVEQDFQNPGWLEALVRRSAERTPARPAALSADEGRRREIARNHAAWKKFLGALKEIKDEPLGEDLPLKLSLTRELPL